MKEVIVQLFDSCVRAEQIMFPVRVCEEPIRVGDWMGGKQVLKIHAYGKELDEAHPGLTCVLVLSGMPSFNLVHTPWCEDKV